jgi:hypothetical protein
MLSLLIVLSFGALFSIVSLWLVKHKYLSAYRRDKILAKMKSLSIPAGLVWLVSFFVISTAYLTFGGRQDITEAGLNHLSIYIYGKFNFRADDMGLVYSLSHWWNVPSLGLWILLIRHLMKYRLWKFPKTRFYCVGYTLVITMMVVMGYFTFIAAPFYGFFLCIVVLLAYFFLICLFLLLGIIKRGDKKNETSFQ